MSGSVIDVTRSGRIAGLDPGLPLLAPALDAAQARGWILHDVRWTPGARCRLAFAINRGQPDATFVAVDVTPDAWVEHDCREDPELRGVGEATDPKCVVQLLAPLLGGPPDGCRIEPVRYRPGSRCVLRYELGHPSQGAGRRVLFAKARPQRERLLAAAWRALADEDGEEAPLVAPFLGEWHDHDVMLAAPVEGPSASSALRDPAAAPADRDRIASDLGRALARLHGHADIDVPPRTGDDQLAALAELLPAARRVDDRTARRMAAIVDALAEHRAAAGPAVLAHGGFRAGQAVVSPSGALVLLDLDGLNRGEAGRDVATALAHLAWQEVKQPSRRAAMRAAAAAFLGGYERHAGPLPPESLAWWRAASLVQLAGRRYRRLEVADWPRLPALVELAETVWPPAVPRGGARPAGGPTPDAVREALRPLALAPADLRVEAETVLGAPTVRRAVRRYTVRGLDGARPVDVIAKSFDEPGRAELVDRHLRALAAGPFHDGPLRVPGPLAVEPEGRLVVFRADAGVPLDRIRDRALATRGVRLAAEWLARLHRSDVDLPRRMDLDREAVTTAEWATVIGEHHPDLLGRARALATGWRGGVAPPAGSFVPIHKDFHAAHVLVGAGACVIDLDEARLGDPALDVAHFLTYLALTREAEDAAVLQGAFQVEYRAAGGPGVDIVTGYVAYTWLKIAKQWATGRAHGRGAGASRCRRGVVDALDRGIACLAA